MRNRRWRAVMICAASALGGTVVAPIAGASVRHVSVTAHPLVTSASESAAIARVKWTSNVTVAIGNGSWTFKSNGLPASNFEASSYAVPSNAFDVSAAGASVVQASSVLKDQNYSYTLPLKPSYAKKVTTTNQGPIGFLLDGAALYNPYEANHATVATSDNFSATSGGVTASFLDSCDGHPGPGGQYHYHGLPSCLVDDATRVPFTVTPVTSFSGTKTTGVSETTAAARRPVILGFAFDGYGIYDNIAMNGKTIPVSALDACNGITSPVPGYPHGVYHYVLENVKGARSSIGCYHGVVSSAYTAALQNTLSGTTPTTSAPVTSTVTPPPSTAVGSGAPATAASLAANTAEDNLLRSVLAVRSITDPVC